MTLLVNMKDDMCQLCWKVWKFSGQFFPGFWERTYIEQNKEVKDVSLSGENFCSVLLSLILVRCNCVIRP